MVMADKQITSVFELDNSAAREHFTALVREHLNWVYAMARRELGDPGLAQDAAQSVFLTLWQHRGRITTGANTGGWLLRATWRACNDIRKSERRRKSREHEAAILHSEPIQSASECAVDTEHFTALYAAVQQLKNSDRAVLAARFFQELGVSEVAAQLGISEAAAEKRISRAVDRLREVMIAQRGRARMHSGALAALLSASASEAPQSVVRRVLQCVGPKAAPVPRHVISLARKLSPHVIRTRLAAAAAAVLLATAIVATPAFIKASPAKLVISRATTYITSPLGKDGLPDYKLALKQYLMKGLTPENNAAVPAIEIAMRGYFSDEANSQWVNYGKLGAAQLKALGATPPGKKFPRIHDIGAFFKRHLPQGYKPPSTRVTGLGGTPSWNLMGLETGYVSEFPWRKSQFFLLWADLYRNRSSIEILRKASFMPRFYLPRIYDPKRFKWPVVYIEPPVRCLGPRGLHAGLPRHAGTGPRSCTQVLA